MGLYEDLQQFITPEIQKRVVELEDFWESEPQPSELGVFKYKDTWFAYCPHSKQAVARDSWVEALKVANVHGSMRAHDKGYCDTREFIDRDDDWLRRDEW